jgi:membrane fusion protein, multidrug efflux system
LEYWLKMAETIGPSPQQVNNKRIQSHHLKWFVTGVAMSLLLGTAYWWNFMRNRVSTDNAYVKADSAQLGSRVPGTILRVFVENDFPVENGQVLVELDPADYKVALERAQAQLAQDEAEVLGAEVAIAQIDQQTAAQVQAAQASLQAARDNELEARHRLEELENRQLAAAADLSLTKRDFERFDNLYRQGAAPERQQDQARNAFNKAKAQSGATDAQRAAARAALAAGAEAVSRAKAQLEAALSERYNVEIQRYRLASLRAKRDKSRAELETAQLNLSYCAVTAPISGVIAQKSIQVGDRVQPGQALMAVVPLQNIYVEANFKETQLTNVRLGQLAIIDADVYPRYSYRGRVVGVRAGTGAAFSLLPAENATGNWIKVVQRVPVKIQFDGPVPSDHPLVVGMSLEVTIDTSNRKGGMLISQKGMGGSNRE